MFSFLLLLQSTYFTAPSFPLNQKEIDQLFPKIAKWMNPEFDIINVLRSKLDEKSGRKVGNVQSPSNALDALPRTMKMLYVHAYQSYIWNCMVTIRLQKKGGLKLMVGDLVLAPKEEEDKTEKKKVAVDQDGDVAMNDSKTDSSSASSTSSSSSSSGSNSRANRHDLKSKADAIIKKERNRDLPKVHVITQQDIDSSTYTVYDVVMPLPGSASTYPDNMLEQYHVLLKEDDTYEIFFGEKAIADAKKAKATGTFTPYHLEGGYRHILKQVGDPNASVVKYYLDDQQIQATDRDKVDASFTPYVAIDGAPTTNAIQIHFNLPSSSYATMCLRQLFGGLTSTVAGGGGGAKNKQ